MGDIRADAAEKILRTEFGNLEKSLNQGFSDLKSRIDDFEGKFERLFSKQGEHEARIRQIEERHRIMDSKSD